MIYLVCLGALQDNKRLLNLRQRLNDKLNDKAAAAAAAAAKKEQASNKKPREISLQVATGSNLLIKIERRGPFVLGSLEVDELRALLVNADP
jgi:hypothetical protein